MPLDRDPLYVRNPNPNMTPDDPLFVINPKYAAQQESECSSSLHNILGV